MTATSIFFNGRVISVPGSYSQVDDTGLYQVGLGASGIVAVLGTAEGGQPASTMTDPSQFIRLSNPSRANSIFRSGDLLEAMAFLFDGSKDPQISGAQSVVAMKINPATQALASFSNALGNALDVKSIDYGAFTSQIHMSIQNGSSLGKLLSIVFEDQTESVDNLGGTPLFNLQYTGDYATMLTGVDATGAVYANGTYARAGLDTDLTAQVGAPSLLSVTATAADAGKTMAIMGMVGTVATQEIVTLINGTATTTNIFTSIQGTYLSAAATGTVTLLAGATTLVTYAAAALRKGSVQPNYTYVANTTFTLAASAASTARVFVSGKNAAGSFQHEVVTLNGTTPVPTLGTYTQITALGLLEVPNAITVTSTVTAAKSSALVQTTLQRLSDYFNARQTVIGATTYGFNLSLSTTQTQLSVSNIDQTSADVTCVGPANPGFNGDLSAIINWINNNSQLVSATKSPGAKGAPSNTPSPVFLSGGAEGVATFADWQSALNKLKQTRVNTVVALTCDPAIAAAIDSHCAYMCGVGRSERDGFVGLASTDLTDVPTLAQIEAQTKALNTRNLRAIPQAVTRYDSSGTQREFGPQFAAALAAGMQAGAPVGTSLTHKYANLLSYRQSSTWNPTDDAERLINSGVMFMQQIDGVGIRWVRNVTTWLQDSKLNNVEGSVNNAVNFAVYNFRTSLEMQVGKVGFSGTVSATKGLAIAQLTTLTNTGVITTWGKLGVALTADVMDVSVEMAPVIPINFIRSVIHLVTTSFSAGATTTGA